MADETGSPQEQLEKAVVNLTRTGVKKLEELAAKKFSASSAKMVVTLAIGAVVTGLSLLSLGSGDEAPAAGVASAKNVTPEAERKGVVVP